MTSPYKGSQKPGHGDHHRDHHGQSLPLSIDRLWPDYLKGGYFDEQGCFKVEYVSREKVESLVKAMCSGRPGLTKHQVRRFFGHCRTIETRLEAAGVPWAALLPDVKKLDIAAADALAKSPPKIPALFHDFVRRNVEAIHDKDDFLRGFLPHFEALVGFGQAHFKERG